MKDTPRKLFRSGIPNPANMKLEPGETLSFFDSIEHAQSAQTRRRDVKRRPEKHTDPWTNDGPDIFSTDRLEAVRDALDRGAVIVEHRFFNAGSSPHRLIIYRFEDYMDYLGASACSGDKIRVWSLDSCSLENATAAGICADDDGFMPTTGAY